MDLFNNASSVATPWFLPHYRNSFHPERSPDLYLQRKPWTLQRQHGTTHGSVYRYDTHVLAAIRWPGWDALTVTDMVQTVDLPVTLAALLGIAAPDDVDGVDRSRLMR